MKRVGMLPGGMARKRKSRNKHVKELKKREEEVRSLQVVEPGVKIHIGEEGNSKENEVTPNKENNNKVGEIPESATITDVPQENCAETDKEIIDVESQHMNEDTTEKQKKKNWRKYLPFTKKTNPPPENGVETDKELKESGKKLLKLLKLLKVVKPRKPELAEEADGQNKKVHETQVEEVDKKKKKRIWKWKKKRAEMTLLPY
ncbi:DNA ligase 1-like isoform X2 [Xenopus laevis]|uniref:DNA ligase 1-like isoform X2 n=1 Tax=Xenopus laevis TaxID=8355 RepID=A0A8J1LP47_XENLA|nr:DNA ligase 1-like isoform X2 [Xenopus laevis]